MKKVYAVCLCLCFSGAAANDYSDSMDFFKDVIDKIDHYYVKEISNHDLSTAAVNGLLNSFDSYSGYLDEDDLNEMRLQTRGEFFGIGIELVMEDNKMKILSCIDGSPAHIAGLKAGDILAAVDNKKISKDISVIKISNMIKNSSGSSVCLTIERQNELIDIDVMKANVRLDTLRVGNHNGVGYIKISSFTEDTGNMLREELKEMTSNGNVKGFILDLRNNPGGLFEQSLKVTDLFVEKNSLIVMTKNRNGEKKYTAKTRDLINRNIPLVVIINSGSASAAEIVAAALRDNNRAVIVGNRSYGKGSVQTIMPLGKSRGAIRLTTAYYYTPNNNIIQDLGIVPDVEVPHENICENMQDSDLNGRLDLSVLYKCDSQVIRAVDLINSFTIIYNR